MNGLPNRLLHWLGKHICQIRESVHFIYWIKMRYETAQCQSKLFWLEIGSNERFRKHLAGVLSGKST